MPQAGMDGEQARGRERRGVAGELRVTDEAWAGSAADLMAGQVDRRETIRVCPLFTVQLDICEIFIF